MSTGNLPKKATPKKLRSPTLKIVSLISLKMLLKRQSELAGLTGHFENEIILLKPITSVYTIQE